MTLAAIAQCSEDEHVYLLRGMEGGCPCQCGARYVSYKARLTARSIEEEGVRE